MTTNWARFTTIFVLNVALSTSVLSAEREECQASITAELQQSSLIHRREIKDFIFTENKKIKVAIFDADDTLRRSKSGNLIVANDQDLEILPHRAMKLAQFNDAGYLNVIFSNQGGIPRYTSLSAAEQLLALTIKRLKDQGGMIHYFDFAEFDDEDRKPGTGMAKRLEQQLAALPGGPYTIDYESSFMVGDAGYKRMSKDYSGDLWPDGTLGTDFSNSDRLFAEALGIPFFHATRFFN